MKSFLICVHAGLSVVLPYVTAYPGLGKQMAEIQARAAAPIMGPEDSDELLGDLASPTTPVGQVSLRVIDQASTNSEPGNIGHHNGQS
jgi:hypothetical protein